MAGVIKEVVKRIRDFGKNPIGSEYTRYFTPLQYTRHFAAQRREIAIAMLQKELLKSDTSKSIEELYLQKDKAINFLTSISKKKLPGEVPFTKDEAYRIFMKLRYESRKKYSK